MPTPTQLVLHHLAIKGIADGPTITTLTGLDEDAVRETTAELVTRELALERTGRLAGFSLTPAGREQHAADLDDDSLRARREELAGWYERFEGVNASFKQLCTDWQLIDGERPNDHTDVAYDQAVLGRLAEVHEQASALLAEAAHERLTRYAGRLAGSAAAVAAGDTRRFTAPLCESYHDVWMELHHDLLTSFGLKRGSGDA